VRSAQQLKRARVAPACSAGTHCAALAASWQSPPPRCVHQERHARMVGPFGGYAADKFFTLAGPMPVHAMPILSAAQPIPHSGPPCLHARSAVHCRLASSPTLTCSPALRPAPQHLVTPGTEEVPACHRQAARACLCACVSMRCMVSAMEGIVRATALPANTTHAVQCVCLLCVRACVNRCAIVGACVHAHVGACACVCDYVCMCARVGACAGLGAGRVTGRQGDRRHTLLGAVCSIQMG